MIRQCCEHETVATQLLDPAHSAARQPDDRMPPEHRGRKQLDPPDHMVAAAHVGQLVREQGFALAFRELRNQRGGEEHFQ